MKPLGSLQAGSLIHVNAGGPAGIHHAVVARTDADGFVYLRAPYFQPQTGNWNRVIPLRTSTAANAPARRVETIDFKLAIEQGGRVLESEDGLSLDPFHEGYIHGKEFVSVKVLPSIPPPTTAPSNVRLKDLALTAATAARTDGVSDDLAKLGLQNYKDALDLLKDVDDVNIVCIPDAANDLAVQQASLNHCATFMKDRIAVLDVPYDSDPEPRRESHRAAVENESGFAALYYPWLLVPEPVEPTLPRPSTPRSLPSLPAVTSRASWLGPTKPSACITLRPTLTCEASWASSGS